MGRNLGFDEKEVLSKITNTFRQKGYEGTSIKDLVKATGLTSGSLYNSYGGKDALFRAALAHYNNNVVRHRISIYLDKTDNPLQGIKNLFHSLLNEPDGLSNGCLLTNTAVEFNNRLRHVSQDLDTGFSLLESGFRRQIEKCTTTGQIPKHSAPQQTATRLLLLYQGILVFVRAELRIKEIEQTLDQEIETIIKGTFV
ncbi:TetR/AcrR family transcriptional regulator [Kiloniella antarctica]|uniref:TetR/AcrR family transcriptional regulator n=1 Tax=Kiloniella antarctica TaxID=1550907 RepID=A0ABW5BNA4_9PROT